MGWWRNLFGGREENLEEVLSRTYRVKIHGVIFELRKITPLAYMSGHQALVPQFKTYEDVRDEKKEASTDLDEAALVRMRKHFCHVFLCGVISPQLKKENEPGPGIWVENLLTDWSLAMDLYAKIMEITYGKKKLKTPHKS